MDSDQSMLLPLRPSTEIKTASEECSEIDPELNNDLSDSCSTCAICRRLKRSQPRSGWKATWTAKPDFEVNLGAIRAKTESCPVCRHCNYGNGAKAGTWGTRLYFDTAALQQSISECQICYFIFHGCKRLVQGAFTRKYESVVGDQGDGDEVLRGPIEGEYLITFNRRREQGSCDTVAIFVEEGTPKPFPMIGQACNPSQHPLDPVSLERANCWLSECLECHNSTTDTACNSFDIETKLPRRVIDVSGNQARIFESHRQSGKYLALSYCWGKSLPLCLTTENIEQMRQCIPSDTIPRTIQDAITVAKTFNVNYLWVDALCILQDSPEDWARESAQMNHIYEEAFFVIQADAAKDCNSGFLHRDSRQLGDNSTLRIRCFDLNTDEDYCIYMRLRKPAHPDSVIHLPIVKGRPVPSKLSTRGWTFQERTVSRRKLVFGACEMGFECRTMSRCECQVTDEGWGWAPPAPGWPELVRRFTKRKLTYNTDRLPAIAGMAAKVSESSDNPMTYICGLWKEGLPAELLWSRDISSNLRSKRIERYCAPTWSWASITGPIEPPHARWPKLPTTYCVEMQDLTFELTSELNPFGPVKEARIILKGPLCWGKVVKSKIKEQYRLYLYHNPRHWVAKLPAQDCSIVEREEWLHKEQGREASIANTLLPANTENLSKGWVLDACLRHDINEGEKWDKLNFNERYLFLFVSKQDIAKDEKLTAGLLLKKVSRQSRSDEDCFQRIGMCSYTAPDVVGQGEERKSRGWENFISGLAKKTVTLV